MIYNNFFVKSRSFTVQDVCDWTACLLSNKSLSTKSINHCRTLKSADIGDIAFFDNSFYEKDFFNSRASFCIIKEKNLPLLEKVNRGKSDIEQIAPIISSNPYLAFANLIDKVYKERVFDGEEPAKIGNGAIISSLAKIGYGVEIGNNATIGDFVSVGSGARIGDFTTIESNSHIGSFVEIGSNCRIYSMSAIINTKIGNNAIIHQGAKLGQDGFGFVTNDKQDIFKVNQIGSVLIGDNFEIGANSCVDRGALDDTVIGSSVKIDNLVQIGHNVIIEDSVRICGHSAIAGSTKIEKHCLLGGAVRVNGHIVIASGTVAAACSGIMSRTKPGEVIAGYPAKNIQDWRKENVFLGVITRKRLAINNILARYNYHGSRISLQKIITFFKNIVRCRR